ncbi:MAG: hypothetical protein AAB288_00735 [Acidobacteriota bacterium]
MTHEEKNIGGGAEYPGSDEQKISQLLSGLKRVEAPKDFDFYLKARIANGRPEEVRPASLFPILKYALPLALFLFVGAGLILNSSYNDWQSGPAVVENPQASEPAVVPQPANSLKPVRGEEVASAGTEAVPEVGSTNQRGTSRGPEVASVPKNTGGGSVDFPSTSRTPLQPGGSVDRTIRVIPTPRMPTGTQQKTYTAVEALRLLGIDAKFENGLWNVRSVKSNEVADQIGVRPGDKVIAIDGKFIDDKTEFDGKAEASTIRVLRGGDTLDLNPKNKLQ